jgi:hypothetical protein
MKTKFTLSAALILISLVGFAQCPTYFKRNNGNGTCGMESEIKMYFATCPDIFAQIDSIYVSGAKANLTIASPDGSKCGSKGYVSYCFNGNLPPAAGINVFFTFSTPGKTTHISCLVPEGVAVLPVLLSKFDAQRSGTNTVTVAWETEQELNASAFEIQRSADNVNFQTIEIIPSKNSNSNTRQFYSFTDNSNDFKGFSLYRIKMVNKDGTFSFSPVKTVKGNNNVNSGFIVFPNPSTGAANIFIAGVSEPTHVMLLDNSGRLLKQTTLVNAHSLQLTNLQKGGYIIKVTGDKSGASSVQKLTVIN